MATKTMPVRASAEKRASFEREALIHLDLLYWVARRLVENAADADDLVQSTMLKAYQAWDQFERGTNAKAWLLTILRHVFVDMRRQRIARAEVTDVEALGPFEVAARGAAADPEQAFFDSLVDIDVVRAIAQLPEAYRQVFLLTHLGELRYHETAAILSVPVGTIKSRLFRARKLLQARLRDHAASRRPAA
jgi:RNA polymerase sigma-70 factor, ECF subfamily